MIPTEIKESPKISAYLQARWLEKQYKKAKNNIVSGINSKVFFREKRPPGSGIWYFRINKQYRAVGEFEGSILYIEVIDDHS